MNLLLYECYGYTVSFGMLIVVRVVVLRVRDRVRDDGVLNALSSQSSRELSGLSYSTLICSTLLLFELVSLLLTAVAILFSEVASATRICVQLIESAFTRMLPLVPMVAY